MYPNPTALSFASMQGDAHPSMRDRWDTGATEFQHPKEYLRTVTRRRQAVSRAELPWEGLHYCSLFHDLGEHGPGTRQYRCNQRRTATRENKDRYPSRSSSTLTLHSTLPGRTSDTKSTPLGSSNTDEFPDDAHRHTWPRACVHSPCGLDRQSACRLDRPR